MAYYNSSLADILNALACEQQDNAPRLSRFPRRQYAARSPFFQDDDDDEESSDGGYYSLRYPDYYSSYFRPRREYTRQAPAQSQPQPPQQPQQTAAPQQYDFVDLLNYLASQGAAAGAASQPAQQQEEPLRGSQQPSNEAQAPSPAQAPAQASSQASAPAPKVEQEKPKIPQKAIPSILHRHSSASFKEPKPKIEISQRNAKNPTLPYSPQTNVYDDDKEYTVVLAIPGATLANLDIDFHPSTNEIVVKGTIQDPFNAELSTKISEIRTGSIERRIKFPTLPKIVEDDIKAKYLNGLLTIRVPKTDEKEVKPKKKVTIEEVPDEELLFEETGGVVI